MVFLFLQGTIAAGRMNVALYDSNEFPETKVGADFTLAEMLAWAKTKPADEEYNFLDSSACAVAQFGIATGRASLVGYGDLDAISPALANAAVRGDWTFGAFAKRLESALA